jgi:hypothetical protein
MSQYKGQVEIKPPNTPTNQGIDRWTWTRASGESWQKFWEGSWSQCLSRANLLKSNWDHITISRKAGNWFRLDASQGGDEYTEIHEVQGSSMTQSVLLSTVAKKRFVDSGVADADAFTMMSKIAAEVRKYQSNQQTYAEMAAAVATIGSNNQTAFDFMDMLDRYGDQALQSQYIYTHTTVVSERMFEAAGANFELVYEGTNRIHTEDEVFAAENIPAEFRLPPRILDGAPAEWLKQAATARTTSGQRRELIVSYLFADEWDRFKYLEAGE